MFDKYLKSLILFIFCSIVILAQKREIKFDHLTVDDGLSQNTIRSILQDKYGFMWFGTDDGLTRYDGYNFTIYRPIPGDSNSISGNHINVIREDTNGILWIGTQYAGLNRFDPQNNSFERIKFINSATEKLSDLRIKSLLFDKNGLLWIGTENSGVIQYNTSTRGYIRYEHVDSDSNSISNNNVSTLFEDRLGIIWIGYYVGGLDRLDLSLNEIEHSSLTNIPSVYRNHTFIGSIIEDSSGVIWIGTGAGLLKYIRKKDSFKHFNYDPSDEKSIRSGSNILVYNKNKFWVCGGNSFSMFDISSETWQNYTHDPLNKFSLNWSNISAVYKDRTGTIWLGTILKGLNVFSKEKYKFVHIKFEPNNPNTILSNDVRAVFKSSTGTIWVGAGGLTKIKRNKDGSLKFYQYNSKFHPILAGNPSSIEEDSSGNIWLKFGSDLLKIDILKNKIERFKNNEGNHYSISGENIQKIYKDNFGNLWICTRGDFYQYDINSGKFISRINKNRTVNRILSYRINAIHRDAEGIFWLGTWDHGLIQFNINSGSFKEYINDPNNPNSLSHNIIHCIWEDEFGNLWLATRGGGLNKFDKETGIFKKYTMKDNLPDNVIYGILGDNEGNLWFSSNNGISKFNPQTSVIRNYDVNDGLQSNEFNNTVCDKGSDGEMLFGGINGFNAFYPSRIIDNPIHPQIRITDISIYDKPLRSNYPVIYNDNFELEYDQNYISFEFVALHYSDPKRNKYAYKLEGIDDKWFYSGTRRFASYLNLPHGDYIFRVRAANCDGIWNEKGISIAFVINPPIWLTWWAYLIYVALFFLGLYSIDMIKTEKIQRKARKEAEEKFKVERAKAEEREKIYSQTAADFHDQVSGEIGTISIYSELLKMNLTNLKENELQKHLSKIDSSARNLINFKDSFLWILDSGDVSLFELANYLKDRGNELFGHTSVNFKLNPIPTEYKTIMLPFQWKRNILFIFIECMNNVIRHAECSNVELHIEIINNRLHIIIYDDGKGFDDINKTGRGMINIKKRAAQLGGKLKIASKKNQGTKTELTIEIPQLRY